MLARQIRIYWVAFTAIVSFLLGTVAMPLIDVFFKTQELNNSERDFVMRAVDLELSHSDRAVPAAALSVVVAHKYLRDQAFATAFSDAMTAQAIAISGNTSPSPSPDSTTGKNASSDNSGLGTSLANQALAASTISAAVDIGKNSGAVEPSSIAPLLNPTKARLFFQIAREDQRSLSANIRSHLSSVLGGSTAIAGDEVVKRFAGATQIRYFFPGDRDEANKIANAMKSIFPKIQCQRIGGYDKSTAVKPRLFEVWIGPGEKSEAIDPAKLVSGDGQTICN